MLNSNPNNEQRSGTDRRMTISSQTPPTGDGEVVLTAVLNRLSNMASVSSIPFIPSQILKEDLAARSAMGAEKYGTVLRTKNGRRAVVDLYQELLDACMYSGQARLEGDNEAGRYLEPLLAFSAQIGTLLDTRR